MDIFDDFARRAVVYRGAIDNSRVYPREDAISKLQQLREPLQDDPVGASVVLSILDEFGSPATVRSSGGRYFGFVTGSSLPGAMVSKLMATLWDQNAALSIMSPVASLAEEVSAGWLLSLLGLPDGTATSFVTGATMANFTALAAARHFLLKDLGWDVLSKGMFGAPEIKVAVGEEVHVSLLKALSLVGFGRERVVRIATDDQGRIIADAVADYEGPAIVCVQAGNVNSGAFDPVGAICRKVKKENVWVHVDGAFGLWAAASAEKKHLVDGVELADSWATDAHKWLNVPYDSGLAFVRHRQPLIESMSATAAYLPETSGREPMQYVPEMSRQARGIAIWGALKSLGKKGLAALIEKNCRQARRFAWSLEDAGYRILNQVDLNQVLVSFGDAQTNQLIIQEIQQEGTCWCGGTTWRGASAMRISVSSSETTDEDVERSLEAIIRIARKFSRSNG